MCNTQILSVDDVALHAARHGIHMDRARCEEVVRIAAPAIQRVRLLCPTLHGEDASFDEFLQSLVHYE
jgi:hypothetical protein